MASEQRFTIEQLRLALCFTELESVQQRTRSWHALRAFRLTASDAPLVLGNFAHKSAAEQQDEVLQRKVSAVTALNRGEEISNTASSRQQDAMAWGTAHEQDGATAYARAARFGLLNVAQMCSSQGQSLPSLAADDAVSELLNDSLLQECGIQV